MLGSYRAKGGPKPDHHIEFPCRVEENEFMVASMRKLGRGDVSFWEFPGRDHGAVEGPANAVIRDFIRRTTIASR